MKFVALTFRYPPWSVASGDTCCFGSGDLHASLMCSPDTKSAIQLCQAVGDSAHKSESIAALKKTVIVVTAGGPALRRPHKTKTHALLWRGFHLVGITGFEPATSSSRTKRATKLRHIPVTTRNTLVDDAGYNKTACHLTSPRCAAVWRRGDRTAAQVRISRSPTRCSRA